MKFFILAAISLAQISQSIGGACSIAAGDQFACTKNSFLVCSAGRWIIQNVCLDTCSTDPAYSSSCFMNAANVAGSAGGVTSGQTATQTAQSTAQSSATDSSILGSATTTQPQSTATAGSRISAETVPTGISNFTIGIIVVCVFIGMLLFIVVFVRYSKTRGLFFVFKNSDLLEPLGETQIEPVMDGVSEVLKKLYVVVKPYHKRQGDEVELQTGDQIELHLLYNDGWSKGFNITSGEQGFIPVINLEAIPVESSSVGRQRGPNSGGRKRESIISIM